MSARARHLYAHLPFRAHRCWYCDFVTVVGRPDQHGVYVDAVLAELDLERHELAEPLETVFVGGGTPTFTAAEELERLLLALPPAGEVTVEASPETVTPALASLLRRCGVNRVSLGAQSFQPRLLRVLQHRAGPDAVREAVYALRDAGFDNISLDLRYGIPGQGAADLDADLGETLALAPEHISWYELDATRGTRYAATHGTGLGYQAEALEAYFERVVVTLTEAGYRWYETANFCRNGAAEAVAGAVRDLRSRHNLAYWRGRDYLGLGLGAVSTLGDERRRNTVRLQAYVRSLTTGHAPARQLELLDARTRLWERLMFSLGLDEPTPLDPVRPVLDEAALARLEGLGLLVKQVGEDDQPELRLTRHGRFLADAVTAELLAPLPQDTKIPANAAS
jgi:putative oxygen-independent coproporphyrinogen III oxidase